MNLAIDLGNTSVQAAFFENSTLKKHYVKITLEALEIIVQSQSIKHIVLSDVGKKSHTWINTLQKYAPVLVLDYQTPLPIENTYKTPQTLGNDRLAAVVGANFLYPNQNNLIADIGTCVTYDFITDKKVYLGGNISAGLQMRLEALPYFTAQLPLVDFDAKQDYTQNQGIGWSTDSAILYGAVQGLTFELEGIIRHYKERFRKFNIIFCGGNAVFFDTKIKESIFVNQKLVLIGLNCILEFVKTQ
jgi:type III pantothenate kinase